MILHEILQLKDTLKQDPAMFFLLENYSVKGNKLQ